MPRKDPAANRKWRREHYAASAAVRAGVKASRVKWENSSPEHKASVLEDLRQRRVAVRDFVRAHKMRVGCADCGYCSNAAALDLHHHGTEKNDTIMSGRPCVRASSLSIGEMTDQDLLAAALDDDELYAELALHIVSNGKIVPFIYNQPQRIFDAACTKQLKERGKVQMLVLKARQMGLSTVI